MLKIVIVKGINFIDLVDAGDPVEQAKHYSENGADEICFLDISASLEKRNTMVQVVEKTANEVFIPLTVGGGISSIDNIHSLLKAGADKTSINSASINNPDIIKQASEYFGNQCIVAVDAKKMSNDCLIFSWWNKNTGLLALEWIEKFKNLALEIY